MKILPTQNEKWGFLGTASALYRTEKVQKAWDKASELIQKTAGFTPQETLALMDSRWDRHTVDELVDEIGAGIEAFTKAFARKMTKDRLYRDYSYYVDPKEYKSKTFCNNENFCKELKRISKLYGITLRVVG